MPLPPPANVEAAFIGPSSTLVRRCEIYESDGITLWLGGGTDPRLVGGSVSIDYARDERRTLDISLDNTNGALRHDPDGFWYDKVIKVYYGVQYYEKTPIPTNFVRTNLCTNPAFEVNTTGWTNNSGALLTRDTVSPISGTASGKLTNGGNASTTFTVSAGDTITFSLSYTTAGTITGTPMLSITLPGSSVVTSPAPLTQATAIRLTVTATAVSAGTGTVSMTAGSTLANVLHIDNVLIENSATTGSYIDGSMAASSNVTFAWTGTAHASTSTQTIAGTTEQSVLTTWEAQIGEFMIDRLDTDNFPKITKVVGRDYTKKCLVASFVTPTAFAAGAAIETVIQTLAINAGVTKFMLPPTWIVTGTDFFFERGSSRWEAMKSIATAYGYDLFFDAQGYLTMLKYQDPVYAATAYTLQTGPIYGNLVKFTKSTNDSRLFNHVVVTGESSDTAVIPVFAEAKNIEPSSPSRIARIGDRLQQFTFSFITTTAQAQIVATNFLRVSALEEYDINFDSIALAWLEVGNIILFLDPDASPSDPTRFLLSSLNINLGLGPMSGNAKRVGIVG